MKGRKEGTEYIGTQGASVVALVPTIHSKKEGRNKEEGQGRKLLRAKEERSKRAQSALSIVGVPTTSANPCCSWRCSSLRP